jgi:hypothetical protein
VNDSLGLGFGGVPSPRLITDPRRPGVRTHGCIGCARSARPIGCARRGGELADYWPDRPGTPATDPSQPEVPPPHHKPDEPPRRKPGAANRVDLDSVEGVGTLTVDTD